MLSQTLEDFLEVNPKIKYKNDQQIFSILSLYSFEGSTISKQIRWGKHVIQKNEYYIGTEQSTKQQTSNLKHNLHNN